MKIVIFATHPIQYQVPLWRRLANKPELDLLVIYGTDMSVRGYKDREFGVSLAWDQPLTEGYRHNFLSTDPLIQNITRWHPSAKGISASINEFKPDVGLLTAYNHLFHLGAFYELRRRKIPIVMRHEASDVALTRSGFKSVLRAFILRHFYRRIDHFAAIGTEAKNHLRRLGVPNSKLGFAPYCVDSDLVSQQIKLWGPQRNQLRTELGISPENKVLLFSGKLIPKKAPLLIAEAIACLKAQGRSELLANLHVVIAGDGQLRGAMEEALRPVLPDRTHFLGFLNQSQMGRAYTLADALVLPSRRGAGETWGLVVNEAMQYGLLPVVSDGVGCHVDLVIPGETGWVFRSDNTVDLARAISDFAGQETSKAATMRSKSTALAQNYSLDAAAAGLIEAIETVARPIIS